LGETRVGVGKNGVLEHKSGNISETQTRKDRGKVTMESYRNSPTLFRTVPSLTPYGLLFPKFATPLKTSIAIISGAGKATDFQFGRYIYRVYPNKSPLKISEKRKRGYIQGLPKVLKFPLLSHEPVKLRTSKFVCPFIESMGTKAH